MIKYQTK